MAVVNPRARWAGFNVRTGFEQSGGRWRFVIHLPRSIGEGWAAEGVMLTGTENSGGQRPNTTAVLGVTGARGLAPQWARQHNVPTTIPQKADGAKYELLAFPGFSGQLSGLGKWLSDLRARSPLFLQRTAVLSLFRHFPRWALGCGPQM